MNSLPNHTVAFAPCLYAMHYICKNLEAHEHLTLTHYRVVVCLCNIKFQNILSTQFVGFIQLTDMLAI